MFGKADFLFVQVVQHFNSVKLFDINVTHNYKHALFDVSTNPQPIQH